MTINMEELEKKMEMKIEGVKAMMLDQFSRVDQKLTVVEEYLKKILETQNQVGSAPEKRNGSVAEKNMEEGGIESRKNNNKGNTVAIRGGHRHEPGPEKPLRAEISQNNVDHGTNDQRERLDLGDRSRLGMPRETGIPHGWIGLYSHHYGKGGPQRTEFGGGNSFCGMSQSESRFRKKYRPSFEGFHEGTVRGKIVNNLVEGFEKKTENNTEKGRTSLGKKAVKTGEDVSSKESLKSESWVGSSGKVADITDAVGEEEQTCSWASCKITNDGKTDALLQDSLELDHCASKDPDLWVKAIENETDGKRGSMESDKVCDLSNMGEEKIDSKNGWNASWGNKGHNKPEPQVANEGPNEKGDENSQREEGSGSKRKLSGSPVEGIPNGSLTATRQHLNIFTPDEQDIVNEIDPIVQSIRRIMHQDRYNDDDPLSTDDQTFILDNVFNHHPEKAQKSGAGVDYIMVSKYKNFVGSRCFYVVSTDGRKEDFSYHKCLKNFVREKYPDKADKFIPKYFKSFEPFRPRNRDHGSSPGEVGTPHWSALDREPRVAADEAWTRSPAWQMSSVGTKQKRMCWRNNAAP